MPTNAENPKPNPTVPTNPRPDVAILGAGAVGAALAEALHAAGYRIAVVSSRNRARAEELAARFPACAAYVSPASVPAWPRLVFLTVPDQALGPTASVLARLRLPPQCVIAHVAGGAGRSILEPLEEFRTGVLYPLQTFSPGRSVDWRRTPLFVEGGAEAAPVLLRAARALSDDVHELDSAARLQLHAGAVFAANFVNFMLACADVLAQGAAPELDYNIYLPLLKETVDKLAERPPHDAQTGPARRRDTETLARHLQMLRRQRPELAPLYEQLTEAIRSQYPE